ncbi:MAG: NAD-binding protein [Desulfomicrobium sp.]|uniref:L-threonate dehydrogenase n=1 Tax=Hoeflea sp. TaxID=1940281 RepID=UPI0025B7B64C|nr:L-threonate dehydrogenase [Hoeflea sp.]MBU4528296.1 NAD-binding protein [Alphaproteobacteria bacterium]MBV1713105.1 NAD-binding protein [Desulfomicrobium sp.]MBU4546287.1 NAD-binding protein [Alphaproteobacteria bacterium]MBU4548888.1 NAD-binding protein [Alphaproteobacteria bacterium]MBV1781819.1 NAD-binding protein [Hoeflea sp.]
MNSKYGRKACIIGLGSMGFGMATTLLRDGFDVVGCDLNADAMARFVAEGGHVADSPKAAASGADVILCVVVNAAQTAAVLFGAGGAASAMAKGGVILSCATMPPEAARDFAVQSEGLGLLYIDAPISGGAVRSAAGDLTIMASGAPEAFAHARPVLDSIAGKVYELGDKAGIGAAFKIVNQLLAGVHIAAACEAITFAKAMDLDIAKVYEVITASAGNSWMFENRVPHILDGNYSPRSAVDIFTKDLGIVSDIGRDLKFPTPIASMALQLFVMTAAAGMGRDDDASVARMIAGLAGLDLPGMED